MVANAISQEKWLMEYYPQGDNKHYEAFYRIRFIDGCLFVGAGDGGLRRIGIRE